MVKVENLSLEEKIGQLFLVGIDGTSPVDELVHFIQRYRIGGVIIDKKNIKTSEQLLNLINTLKSQNVANQIPLFIAIEQEGGSVTNMPADITAMPSIREIAGTGNKNIVIEASKITGDMLSKFGFNFNLAPTLDVGNDTFNNFKQNCFFSNNENIVASYGILTMKAMNEKGIITAIKHFPGKGSVKKDMDSMIIPYTKKSIAKLEEKDILPFKQAMKEGADCMMVGHINLTKFNLFAPATTSKKVIKGLIRGKYGYDGVLVTEDLCALSMEIQYGLKDSVKRAIKAGNDILVIKQRKRLESVIDYITRLVIKEKINIEEINNSVNRILKLKEKYIFNEQNVETFDVDEFNTKISKLKDQIKL